MFAPNTSKLRAEVERILRLPISEKERREKLEPVATDRLFGTLTDFWGPELYRRDRILWRPFILHHFSSWSDIGIATWKGDTGKRLETWLADVDRDGDVELFRRIFTWKLDALARGDGDQLWRRELADRFTKAMTHGTRNEVLAKFETWRTLDEETASRLYSADRGAASPFILRHLPFDWSWLGEARTFWDRLGALALELKDENFYFALYRRRIPIATWSRDVARLADATRDAQQLLTELAKRHPEGWGLKLGDGYYELVKRRGRDVFPYVLPRLKDAFSGWGTQSGYQPLLALAEKNEWHDLWSALIRTGADQATFDRVVRDLVTNTTLPDNEAKRRLLMLTGVSREWNFGPFSMARVLAIDDVTAVKLYRRFPALMRGPYKMNIGVRYGADYDELTRLAIENGDEELIDHLGSRAAMLNVWKDTPRSLERLADYYAALIGTPALFAIRAAAALTKIPAFAIWNYDKLLLANRLARILFERTEEVFLSDARAMRDLLESPQIYVQALAFRALAIDSDRARSVAAANADLLQATLFRPLHRRTRLMAFGALRNAASHPDVARYLAGRIREAFDLPEERYPREQLIGLLGQILHRWPEIRGERERPVVYGEVSV